MVIFLTIEMDRQSPLFLVMEIAGEPLADPLEMVSPWLAAPALCFRMRTGGIATLNLAHLVSVTLHPGLQHPPAEAWPARRVRPPSLKSPEENWGGPADGRVPPPIASEKAP